MKRITLVLLVLSLTACASPASHKRAVMAHPETKQTVQCEVDPWKTWQWNFKEELQECVEAYEQAGFERMS